MINIERKRKYFTQFSIEQHSEIVTVDQLLEIQRKFYLSKLELAYLFGVRPIVIHKIMKKKVTEIPFTIQLNLYYLMQDPAMIYKLIKEKKKFELAKEKAEKLLQQQGTP